MAPLEAASGVNTKYQNGDGEERCATTVAPRGATEADLRQRRCGNRHGDTSEFEPVQHVHRPKLDDGPRLALKRSLKATSVAGLELDGAERVGLGSEMVAFRRRPRRDTPPPHAPGERAE